MGFRVGLAVLFLLATGCSSSNPGVANPSPASGTRVAAPPPMPSCTAPTGCPVQWFPAGLAFDVDRQTLVLFGGSRSTPQSATLDETWEWNAARGWTMRHPSTAPPARNSTVMTYDPA